MAVEETGFSHELLIELEKALARGVTTVTYATSAGGTKSVTYRSLAEMLRIRTIMRNALGLSSTNTSLHPTFSKGLGCK